MTQKQQAAHAVAEINKLMGAGTVRSGSDEAFTVKYLSTGVLPIDHILGGGFPRNRVTEIFGDYSTLKSYIGLRAIASCQQSGGLAAIVDTEHSFDADWATALGVDVGALIVEQPETGELAVDVTEALIRNGADLIVWDSVAATLPQAEAKKRMHDESVQPARLAALMSLAMRKLTAANSNTAMLFINQTRLNVGVMFGSPETTPGGKALPFYASYRVAVRKAGRITDTYESFDGEKKVKVKRTTAVKIRVTVEKSKLSAPYRETWFTFDLQSGTVDELGYIITLGVEEGVVINSGQTWQIAGDDASKKRGLKAFRAYLDSTPTALTSLATSLGVPVHVKRKAVGRKAKSSRKSGRNSTRGQERAASKKTAVTKRASTKSKTQRSSSRSRRRT